jgi:hypothetical protein
MNFSPINDDAVFGSMEHLNGCHFYSFLNGFTNIGHVKSVCEIALILRLIDFLTINVSSENLVCAVQFEFFGVL